MSEIRSYAPGTKFSTVLDEYVWNVSLEGGCDAEIGSVTENGHWYGLMRDGHSIFRDHDPFCEPLNEAEREQLKNSAGVILTEDSYGFVRIEYFDEEAALNAAWSEIEFDMLGEEHE